MAYLLYPASGAIFHDRYLHQEGKRAIAANNSRDRQPYQKLKIVKVQQHDRTHDYSFEIKKPLNYDPNFQLEHSISYGLGKSTQYYEISAYILGKPYFTFEDLNLYGFKYTYTALLNIIKKFEYFVRIMVKP